MMETMFEKVETPEDVSVAVIAQLTAAEPGRYRVAVGQRKELERLRLAIKEAGYVVACRGIGPNDEGVHLFAVEATVTTEAGVEEPKAEVVIPSQPRKAKARGVAKMESVEEDTPLETGV